MPRNPDLETQRAAMRKLEFLAGRWSGEGRMWRGPGEPMTFSQIEQAQYRLDGLVLEIEGVARTRDGKTVLQALGMVSYDDAAETYHLRAFNDGRFLETEVRLLQDGQGMRWGFHVEQVEVSSILRMNQRGEWTEEHEIVIGSAPARRLME